ncbi:MAG: type II toxin-antitoxin system PemK/MazF family toxin [Tyzzerella sp.]|nr:type II toxin-antitoxin system PemK/MazF family toxin [Tyzzerella sp.]
MNGLLKGLKVEDTAQKYERGEIYYINNGSGGQVGSEMKKDRPAIIVSNDANNKYSSVVEVVYLTSKPKKELPTHVTIRSTGRMSVALCEEPTAISTERINNYICKASDKEMENIDVALMIALGINMTKEMQQSMEDILTGKIASGGVLPAKQVTVPKAAAEEDREKKKVQPEQILAHDLLKMQTERDIFKKLYEDTLQKLLEK